MSGLLGALVGLGGSVIPEVTDILSKRTQNKFELQKMDKQLALIQAGYTHEMAKLDQEASDNEHQRLIDHDIAINSSLGWMGGLQKSVRPVITYSFFGLFALVEISLLYQAMQMDIPLDQAIASLWDEDTKSIWGSILGFWFGTRAIEKSRRGRK